MRRLMHGRDGTAGGERAMPAAHSRAAERDRLFATSTAQTAPTALSLSGAFPRWLAGTLVRNGPAAFESGRASLRHWFDGSAMLHRFDFADGGITYASRLLDTRHRRAMADGRPAMREFGTDPCYGLFGRVMSAFRPNLSDNANINVARLGDDYVALAESALPVVFDRTTLATLGTYEIDGRDRLGQRLTTAHPIPDGRGGMLSHQTRLGAASRYEIVRLDPLTRRQETLARVPVKRPSYMHSFAVSQSRAVLSAFPLTVDPLDLLMARAPFIESHRWQPELGTQFHVVDRRSGAVQTCRTDAAFAFHHVNAFDEGDDLVIDLVGYDDPAIIGLLYLDRLRADPAPRLPAPQLRRYRLTPSAGRARLEHALDAAVELPSIDERCAGRRHRLVWGVGVHDAEEGGFPNAVGRFDLDAGTRTWWSQPHCYAGEPVFVPRPGSGPQGEGDGVLLSLVLDARADRSFLVVLDASTLVEIARAALPVRVPAGLHGRFFHDQAAPCGPGGA